MSVHIIVIKKQNQKHGGARVIQASEQTVKIPSRKPFGTCPIIRSPKSSVAMWQRHCAAPHITPSLPLAGWLKISGLASHRSIGKSRVPDIRLFILKSPSFASIINQAGIQPTKPERNVETASLLNNPLAQSFESLEIESQIHSEQSVGPKRSWIRCRLAGSAATGVMYGGLRARYCYCRHSKADEIGAKFVY